LIVFKSATTSGIAKEVSAEETIAESKSYFGSQNQTITRTDEPSVR
jgi:hypothetical protein